MAKFNKSAAATHTDELGGDALIKLAEERVLHGLSPPPKIYQIEYRRCIDWSKFPTWARPVDPEVFNGCCHEG